MKEYKIVSASNAPELEKAVNKLLQDGWELHGNIAVSNTNAQNLQIYQPMIKETTEDGIPRSTPGMSIS